MENGNFKILLAGRKEEWRLAQNALIEAGNRASSNDIRETLYAWADKTRARCDECEAILNLVIFEKIGDEA